MKPISQKIENEKSGRSNLRHLPLTDYNYQSVDLESFGSPCSRTDGSSFFRISNDYFKTEASKYFLAEASVFAAILATAALPLINGAHAVLHLVSTLGAI